jgi:putative glycosyltransferase
MTPAKVSIVTTLYRSAPYVAEFCRRASLAAATLFQSHEIILVNDGSPDDSISVAKDVQKANSNVVLVDLARNFGHHRALMTGLAFATGDYLFALDGDLEEEPEWLASFYESLQLTHSDLVFGVQARRKGDLFERWSGGLFYRLFNSLAATPIPANMTVARLMTRRFADQLLRHHERELFLFGLCQITGFRQTGVPVTKHDKGSSVYSLRRKIDLFINAITAFTDRPLISIFYVGAGISSLSFLYICVLVMRRLVFGISVLGWTSLIVSVWFLGGLTILFIGILGLYVSKVFSEVKRRPYAIIQGLYPSNHPAHEAGLRWLRESAGK